MAECRFCKAETQLYERSVPICLKCSGEGEAKRKPPSQALDIHSVLYQEAVKARDRVNSASKAFSEITANIPSELPHPDGMQRIRNAANQLKLARKEMRQAYSRLNDYLTHRIVPKDVKQSG